MEFEELTLDQIKTYIEHTGQRGSLTLSVLGKIHPSIKTIFSTEVGREILSDDLSRIDELLIKIYKQSATDVEIAELNYLREKRIPRIIGKLKIYLEKTGEIKKFSR